MTIERRPTSQRRPTAARPTSSTPFEALDPVSGQWSGFPFPPPLLGIDWATLDQAATRFLAVVADLITSGEANLNTLFAAGAAKYTCDDFELPPEGLRVVPAVAIYTLGSVHPGPASLTALFAAPRVIQLNRLQRACDQLAANLAP